MGDRLEFYLSKFLGKYMKELKENSNFVDYPILRKITLNQVKNVA